MFQHKEIKSAKERVCLKTGPPTILAFTWRPLGGEKKGLPNLKSAVFVCISFSNKYLKMASVIYLCASSHISNIGLREGREAVNIRAIMSPPLHSLWLIGSYKGGNMKTFVFSYMFVQIWQIFARLNISAQTDILLARSARDDFLNTVRLFQVKWVRG